MDDLSAFVEYPLLVANELVAETADVGIVSSSLSGSDRSNRSLIHDPCECSDGLSDNDDRPSSGLAGSELVTMDKGGDNGGST